MITREKIRKAFNLHSSFKEIFADCLKKKNISLKYIFEKKNNQLRVNAIDVRTIK